MLCTVPEENESCTWCKDASYCCMTVTRYRTEFLLLLQLFKSSLNTALLLHSEDANDGPAPLCEEIFRSSWLILERESYALTAAHSGSCLQKHHVAFELTIHVMKDRQDAGWTPIQAGDTRRTRRSTRQQTNKQTYHHCVILLIWNDHTPAPELAQICSFR